MTATRLGTKAGEVDDAALIDRLLRLARDFRRAFPRHGFNRLEPAELQVLLLLTREPGLTVGGIARALPLARTSVSNALAALNERGYLFEVADRWDRRVRHQELTPGGATVVRAFIGEARTAGLSRAASTIAVLE